MIFTGKYASPRGEITLATDGNALVGLWFDGQKFFGNTLEKNSVPAALPIFEETKNWLDAYFRGNVPASAPRVKFLGTPFQISVWKMLEKIPYGKTTTYGALAEKIARERGIEKFSARAVGSAVGRNPVSIIVPCHRVVGSGGKIVGYAGGISSKIALLEIERAAR